MPLHDYVCRTCQIVQADVYRSIDQGAQGTPPVCPRCDQPMRWIPQVGRMDAGSGSSFTAFDTDVLQPDGSHRTVHIDSLRKLRQVERETEIAARNGEGQPLRWRDYSQDRSNADVNLFGPDPAQQARAELETLRQAVGARGRTARTTVDPTAITTGPGVPAQGVSPLEA